MVSHWALEQRVRDHLEREREKEGWDRPRNIRHIMGQIENGDLQGEYPSDFSEQLGETPPDWRIDDYEEGVRFQRDFPYEHLVYGMKGWDAAGIVVNLDTAKNAVAVRAHFYDGTAGVMVEEGLLFQDQDVAALHRTMTGGGMYRPVLGEIQDEFDNSNGASGCIMDHMKVTFDELPTMVRELCGDSYGVAGSRFIQLVHDRTIDLETMPHLTLGWPLNTPYLNAR